MKTVLVIDDEEKICWAFEQFLTEEGYRPLVAQNAEEGLRQIERENPDAVFLDVHLPGMDGLDALKQIKARGLKVAVIIITASPSARVITEAKKLSVHDYLIKPIDLDEARRVLEDAINAREVSGEQISSGKTIPLCAVEQIVPRKRRGLRRRLSFSFLSSIIIHLIALLIAAFFVITASEKLSDYVQVEWLRMSQPIGTHGTEFLLPGKGVGLSDKDWPDIVMGSMPNINPWILNNLGESLPVKRRAYAVLIDYLPPPLVNAGLSDELLNIHNDINKWDTLEDGALREKFRAAITQQVKSAKLDNDLHLDLSGDRLLTPKEIRKVSA